MKKILALLCTLLLICGLTACNPAEDAENPQELPANIEEMTAPIDALARCMLENNITYAPDDAEFFWTAMFYATGGYGLTHPLATEHTETYQIVLPAEAMQEFAAALFADTDTMPAMPASMEGNISYVSEENAYFISRGDIGLSECKLTDFAQTNDGYTVTAELWSTGDSIARIAAWEVALTDGAEDAFYPYRISDMTLLEDDSDAAEIPEQVGNAIFNGLTDSHTAELTLPDGTVQAFQFDPDSSIAEVFSSLGEGEGITIHYTNSANGGATLLAVE